MLRLGIEHGEESFPEGTLTDKVGREATVKNSDPFAGIKAG